MIEFGRTIEKVVEKFPSNAIDISESLELLKDTLDETIIAINQELSQAMNVRDFKNSEESIALAKSLYGYEKQLDQLIEMLDVELIEDEIDLDEATEIERIKIPNYGAYIVDTDVEHTLYEDFTHKRPHAFKINEDTIIEVQTWKDLFIRTCELLGTVDGLKFRDFENNPKMNGKRRKYFSTDASKLRKPYKVNDIYIETNINGNGIRNLIIKMLQQYGFKINDFKVFLRADYTDLHKQTL